MISAELPTARASKTGRRGLRIALVTREYPPETAWGGIGTFYGKFAEYLSAAGCDVEVFTQGVHQGGSHEKDGVLIHRVLPRKWILGQRAGGDLAGMEAKHLGVFAMSLAAGMWETLQARHREKPFDIVEGHEHLGINALINLRFRRTPLTITRYHTAYHTLVSRQLANWPRSRLIRWLEKTSIRQAGARITASSFIENWTRADFPDTPASDASIPLFSGGSAEDADPPPFQAREKLVLFVGRLMPKHKNPELVAQAFSVLAGRFPEWRVEFAGLDIEVDGESTWARCERFLAPFSGRFRYHGVLDPHQLRGLYGRARIVAMPSGFESFGLVALEAMSNGCVPLVSADSALPEIVGDAGAILPDLSLETFTATLSSLMQDPARQEILSQRCTQRAAQAFSHEAILARNLEVFEELLRRVQERS
jgi:glycosyltransferase involved in cell wall biosynthesis